MNVLGVYSSSSTLSSMICRSLSVNAEFNPNFWFQRKLQNWSFYELPRKAINSIRISLLGRDFRPFFEWMKNRYWILTAKHVFQIIIRCLSLWNSDARKKRKTEREEEMIKERQPPNDHLHFTLCRLLRPHRMHAVHSIHNRFTDYMLAFYNKTDFDKYTQFHQAHNVGVIFSYNFHFLFTSLLASHSANRDTQMKSPPPRTGKRNSK